VIIFRRAYSKTQKQKTSRDYLDRDRLPVKLCCVQMLHHSSFTHAHGIPIAPPVMAATSGTPATVTSVSHLSFTEND